MPSSQPTVVPPADGPIGPDGRQLSANFDGQERDQIKESAVDTVDVAPDRLKSEVPVFFAPGWGATTSVYRQAIIDLANTGRRVIAAAMFPERLSGPTPRRFLHQRWPALEIQKAEMAIALLEQKKVARVDAVGHSESAFFLALAALYHPERFRNLVFVNPVALGRRLPPWRMLWRSFKEYRAIHRSVEAKQVSSKHVRSSMITHLKVFMANPRLHMSPFHVFLESALPPVLRKLKLKGHKIAIVHGVDDQLFPVDELLPKITDNIVDTFYPVSGTHSELHLNPEAITKVIDQALNDLAA